MRIVALTFRTLLVGTGRLEMAGIAAPLAGFLWCIRKRMLGIWGASWAGSLCFSNPDGWVLMAGFNGRDGQI